MVPKRVAKTELESEEEEGEEEEEELIQLDSATLSLSCGFQVRVWDDLVPEGTLMALHDACAELGTSDSSFWVGAKSTPRTPLERYALDVWSLHMGGRVPEECDPACSGVEYWVQRRSSRMAKAEQSINWHFDKDEGLREEHGLFVHPYISTVTYLCDSGAPTVVMPVEIDTSGADVRVTGEAMPGVPGDGAQGPTTATLSYPRRGRHLAFNGRALHGCPVELAFARQKAYERQTVLVNIWLNHRPCGVEAAPPPAAKPPAKRARSSDQSGSLTRPDAPPQLEVPALAAAASKDRSGGARSGELRLEFPVGDSAAANVSIRNVRALRQQVERAAVPPVLSVGVDIAIAFDEQSASNDDDASSEG